MPAEFNKLGISFQYPDNWILDEEDALAGERAVTVYSPGGAFWSVSVHPRSANPDELAKAAAAAIEEEYEEVEAEETREALAGCESVGFDFNFFYLDFTNTATVRCLRGDEGSYVIFCQAEDREYEQLQRVFQAITVSFLNGLRSRQPE
jgi:hypothetical protein